jgi:hypothetical protein
MARPAAEISAAGQQRSLAQRRNRSFRAIVQPLLVDFPVLEVLQSFETTGADVL